MKSRALGWTPRVLQAYLHQLVERLHLVGPTATTDKRHDRVRRRLVALLARSVHAEADPSARHRRRSLSLELPPKMAKDLVRVYRELPVQDRAGMVAVVVDDLSSPDHADLKAKMNLLSAALDMSTVVSDTDTARSRLLGAQHSLRNFLTPLYMPLLEAMLRERGGLETVMTIRGDALDAARPNAALPRSSRERDALRLLAADLRQILRSHFSSTTLDLRQITSDAPEELLKKIADISAKYSPQPVTGVAELRSKRICSPNRVMFALFHPFMEHEPLMLAEVAFANSDNLPNSIVDVLHSNEACETSRHSCDTAVFYSITAAQPGLAGMELGGEMIKRIVREQLHVDGCHHNVSNFVTLSPMPGFASWLQGTLPTPPNERAITGDLAQLDSAAARYLVLEKKRGAALDSVANFHLCNGASIERILRDADRSEKRIEESQGMMVSYGYDMDKVDENASEYMLNGSVQCSNAVRTLLRTNLGRN